VAVINPEIVPSNVKLNVTNVKSIFNGGGKGGAIVPKGGGGLIPNKGGPLAKSSAGALSTEKLFELNTVDPLEKRVAANERKITLLKKVFQAQKPFGGNEDKLAEINSILEDIGNALSLDFANRISEQKRELALKKKEDEDSKRSSLMSSLMGGKKGLMGKAMKLASPITSIFSKIISAITLIGAGILTNAAFEWWNNLDDKTKTKITDTLSWIAKQWKWIAFGVGGILLFTAVKKIVKLIKGIRAFIKVLRGIGKGIKSIFKFGFKKAGKRAIIKAGGKNLLKKTAVKTTTKITSKVGAKAGAKVLGKSVLKKIPFVGLGAALLFAGQRAMAGDFTGAGLELASGAASTIPGVGTAASIAIDAATVARDIKRANNEDEIIKQDAKIDKVVKETQIPKKEKSQPKIIVEDLPPVKVNVPPKDGAAGSTTEVEIFSAINPLNEYMKKTPVLHGIMV